MQGIEDGGLRQLRAQLLADAYGDVVEIGAGTGRNLPFYRASVQDSDVNSDVRSIVLTETDATLCRQLEAAVSTHQRRDDISVVRASADALPIADSSVDTVVSTLVFCGVPEQETTICEITRVLRPGGQLLLIEHVRAHDPGLAQQQDRANRLNRFFTGCECNRPTRAVLEASGFDVSGVRDGELPGAPALVRPMIIGRAIRPSVTR